MCYEQKEFNNAAVEEGQGLGSSEEYEPRFNEVTQDVNTGPIGLVQVGDGLQIPQQQSQGSVRWERFLPVRSLKVLLVENDDSTRHVVTALLRNCSYEVVAVGNGHQAWKILEDATNHIELVLTEVVLPVLSGIGLLCKIMSHQNLKNIPVIMMSSHDSLSTVFKCLSKGAVDFLVKPIRKNELKNLWQHIWRRCHSSSGSGSGSESGTQTKKYVKSKGNDESENNSGSSDEHYGGSNGLSIRDGSDNGSGTQSSWTKRAAEDDSPQPTSPQTQWLDAPDSICAQAIDTKPEKHSNIEIHAIKTKEFIEQDEKLDNVGMGRDLELGVSKHLHLHYTYQQEKLPIHSTSKKQNRSTDGDRKPFDNGQLEHNGENLNRRTRNQVPKIVGAVFNRANPHGETINFDKTSSLSDTPQMKPEGDSEGLPSLELTLKRLRGVGDVGNIASEDRNVLRHSDLSAFSKYNSAFSNQVPTANAGSCSPLENIPVAPNKASPLDFSSISNGTHTNHQPNENNCNNEMASTSKHTIPKPETLNEKPESRSTFLPFHSSGASNSTQKAPTMGEDTKMVQAQATGRDSIPPVQVQHHHHHHHYHHHVHSMQHHQQEQTENNDPTLDNMEETAQQCGSSNVFGGNIESNAGNYSVNGSASGSNHVSNNGENGNIVAVNTGARNVESDNGVAVGNSGSGVDKGQAAQREAALNKFRQKRKERCFEKKVRYHSRKKLAEQRPRIRGQFVRQIASSSKEEKDCESKNIASGDNSCKIGNNNTVSNAEPI